MRISRDGTVIVDSKNRSNLIQGTKGPLYNGKAALNNHVKRCRAVLDWGILGHCEAARSTCVFVCVCTLRALTMGSPVGALIRRVWGWTVGIFRGERGIEGKRKRKRIRAAATGEREGQGGLGSIVVSWRYYLPVHAMPLSARRQCWLAFKVSYICVRARSSLSLSLWRGARPAVIAANDVRTDEESRQWSSRGQVSPFIEVARRTFIRNR